MLSCEVVCVVRTVREPMKKSASASPHSRAIPAGSRPPETPSRPGDGHERPPAPDAPDPSAIPLDGAQQGRLFDEAVGLFRAGNFQEARQRFELAARGPSAEMAHAARQRARMCEQRLARMEPALSSAEDHYNYAVVLLNLRRWEQAEAHLHQALAENPRGDHIYYALAVCRCWRGDLEAAARFMRRAIEIQPQNAIVARNDPDLAPFAQQFPLVQVLSSDRTQPQ